MNKKIIIIDGISYGSVEEMPPDVRAKYEKAMSSAGTMGTSHFTGGTITSIFADNDNNGIPDILEHSGSVNIMSGETKFVFNGKEYDSFEHLPPDVQQKYKQGMARLVDKDNNGIPDFVDDLLGSMRMNSQQQQRSSGGTNKPKSTVNPVQQGSFSSRNFTPDTSNGLPLVLIGLSVFFLCAAFAFGAWYFFLR